MTTPTNILLMSDEELANLDPSTLVQEPSTESPAGEEQAQPDAVQEQEEESQEQEQPAEEVKDDNSENDNGEATGEEQSTQSGETKNPLGEGQGSEAAEITKQEAGQEKPKPAKQEATPEGKKEPEQKLDYKAELERVLSPIKANGREIQVSSVDDAIQLMQMGANYHKKMAALKPNLAVLKMLENNGLLDQSKISYLIDLDKKNPEAIKKLVKEAGIDPLDIDTSKADGYKANDYSVDPRALDLDNVLDELKESPKYNQLLKTVGSDWDNKSRQIVADNPELLRVIHGHMSTGIYDKITSVIETERALGRLSGLSDLEAYRNVGDRLQSQGAFNSVSANTATATKKIVPVKAAPKPETSESKNKKLAASSSRASAPVKQQTVNLLAMSDDELAKFDITKFTTR